MQRFRADVFREQVLEVEFEVEDTSQDLAAVAREAANGEWFEAETLDVTVQSIRVVNDDESAARVDVGTEKEKP